MEWYYVEAGQQAGPVTEEQLNAMVASGKIRGDTLVWRAGMENWTPYRQANLAPVSGQPAVAEEAAAVAVATAGALEAVPEGQVQCLECRQTVAQDQAIQYGQAWVCGSCKPHFLQKLKEGAVTQQSVAPVRYGGFWIRVLAKLIDGVVQTIVLMIPMVVMVLVLVGSGNPNDPGAFVLIQVIYQVLALAVGIGYNTFFLGKWGATLGKMACGLKVVQAGGLPITYMRAFGRAWAEYLNMFTIGIGYIIVAFDSEKRALHDHICNTRVIKSR